MVVRAIALSLALLVGVGTLIPLATEYAEAGPRRSKRYKKQYKKKYKKYSKAWWRQYHAQARKRKALQARRRAMRLRQIRLARAQRSDSPVVAKANPASQPSSALLPSGAPAPRNWKPGGASGSEVRFRVDGGNGFDVGSASISVLGPAMGETVAVGRRQMVGGVPTSSLRREVINRMVRENGWVVNDYQKHIGGKDVYVVVAQSQAGGGRVESRMFYFTEVEGRIYTVATNSQTDAADRIAEESEKVIASLQGRAGTVQQASTKEEE